MVGDATVQNSTTLAMARHRLRGDSIMEDEQAASVKEVPVRLRCRPSLVSFRVLIDHTEGPWEA